MAEFIQVMHWWGLFDWQAIQLLTKQGEHPLATLNPWPGGQVHFPSEDNSKGSMQDEHFV